MDLTNTPSKKKLRLSNKTLVRISAPEVAKPGIEYQNLPVKVLQFGTGVLLRGLIDHVIDKANRNRVFNGRIAVVKSTGRGNLDVFVEQNNLYTLLIRGIENKQSVEQAVINSAISEVLSVKGEWELVLKEAENPNLKIIISNTTEVGIQLFNESIDQHPPVSFPAKLLAVLYHRYKFYNGSEASGLVIVPTELLPNNGAVLKSIIMELIHYNSLNSDFANWVNNNNFFCSSLVDKIVTGRPSDEERQIFEDKNGYTDELLIVAEPYCLWAIEGNDVVKAILSFEQIDEGVIVIPDITVHRELKLGLLNGVHTLSCAIALINNFDFVNAAVNDSRFSVFLQNLMAEIKSAILCDVDSKVASDFSDKVLDRFKNPFINHQWTAISQQYTTKIITRVLPVLKKHYELYNSVPKNIAKGFAGYLFLMSKIKVKNDNYYIQLKGLKYSYSDEKAQNIYEKIKTASLATVATLVLSSADIWGEDLNRFPKFTRSVQNYLNKMVNGDRII